MVQIIVFKLPVLPIHPSNKFDFMSHEYITTTINKLVMNGVLMYLRFTLFLESILRFENKVVLFDHRTDQPTVHALLSVSFFAYSSKRL